MESLAIKIISSVASALFTPIHALVQTTVSKHLQKSDREIARDIGKIVQREIDVMKQMLNSIKMRDFNASLLDLQQVFMELAAADDYDMVCSCARARG